MKVGRNDPCPCGSGLKQKRCCGMQRTDPAELLWARLRRLTEPLATTLLKFAVQQYDANIVEEAWTEFDGYSDAAFDPETIHLPVFMPWFFYHWTPDPQDTEVPAERVDEFPLAGSYLRKRRRSIDPLLAEYIEAACDSPFSFFDIVSVSAGEGLVLRDILRGSQTEVVEHSASKTLNEGDLLFAKVVAAGGLAVLEGCAPVAFSPSEKHSILKLRKVMRKGASQLSDEYLRDWDIEMLDIYRDKVSRVLNPPPIEIRNTDGDPLALCRIRYAVPSGRAAFEALQPLALGRIDIDDFDMAVEAGETPELSWLKDGNAKHPGWDNTVLGRIMIDGDRVVAEVNSEERAVAFRHLADEMLPAGSEYLGTVVESVERLLTEGDRRSRSDSEMDAAELNARPEVQAMLTEQLRNHYREWPKISLPALDGMTPLEAMRTPDGREMVEALLIEFERAGNRRSPPLDASILVELRATLDSAIPS